MDTSLIVFLIWVLAIAVLFVFRNGNTVKDNINALGYTLADLLSWYAFKKNRWHLHLLAFPIGILVSFLLKPSFQGANIFMCWSALAIGGWVMIWIYECNQGRKEIENKAATMARLKDVYFTTGVYWIAVLIGLILF